MSTPAIPSTTIKGLLLAVKEVPPRSRNDDPLAGSPEPCTTDSPATFPCKTCSVEEITPFFKSFDDTDDIAPVRSDFLIVPYPTATTTVSFNEITLGFILMDNGIAIDSLISKYWVSKLINEITSVLPDGTLRENSPSIPVIVPFVVPSTTTDVPGSGAPVSSVTIPSTDIVVVCWANPLLLTRHKPKARTNTFKRNCDLK